MPKVTTAANLKRRRNRWFARYQVPADVLDAFDGRREVWVTTGTGDPTLARVRAAKIIAELRARVIEARGRVGAVDGEALWWREQLKRSGQNASAVYDALAAHAADRFVSGGRKRLRRAGTLAAYDGRELEAVADLGGSKAAAFIATATGTSTPLAPFIEPFANKRRSEVEAKTADMEASDLRKLVATEGFATVEDLTTRGAVAAWIETQTSKAGLKPEAVKRKLSGFRQFWRYLKDRGEVPEGIASPFDLKVPRGKAKDAATGSYVPFTPGEVLTLYKAAKDKDDGQLADLIALAAYTGARIEELCALPVSKVDTKAKTFTITDAKTKAGNRVVPIHAKLVPMVRRLVKASDDGFLLSGLSQNKYGDRGNAIGKRFGYLKVAHRFTERHTFHSIRKTVVTQMEQAGFPENVTADVVGHDRPRVTYGLYSGGSSVQQRRDAVACLSYPGALGRPA